MVLKNCIIDLPRVFLSKTCHNLNKNNIGFIQFHNNVVIFCVQVKFLSTWIPNYLTQSALQSFLSKIMIHCFLGKIKFDNFFLHLVYKKNIHYWLYYCASLISGKSLVPETATKMLSAKQIARFLNQLYLFTKIIK